MKTPEEQVISRLPEVLAEVREEIEKAELPSIVEAETVAFFIMPVVKALGWKGLGAVKLEYQVPGGDIVDIALCIGKNLVAFVEAKRVATRLSDKDVRQVLSQGTAAGVRWCLLTNGREYRLYDQDLGVELKDKLVFSVELDQDDKEGLIARLSLLSRSSLESGTLAEKASYYYYLDRLRMWFEKGDERLLRQLIKAFPSSVVSSYGKKTFGEAVRDFIGGPVVPPPPPPPPPNGGPLLPYVSWELAAEGIKLARVAMDGTRKGDETLPLDDLRVLAEAVCQLAKEGQELTVSKVVTYARRADGSPYPHYRARQVLAVLYHAGLAEYTGRKAPVTFRLGKPISTQAVMARVQELGQSSRPVGSWDTGQLRGIDEYIEQAKHSAETEGLTRKLHQFVTGLSNVRCRAWHAYVAYACGDKNFSKIHCGKTQIWVWLKILPDELRDPQGLVDDLSMSRVREGKWGHLRVKVKPGQDLAPVKDLIRQAYDYATGQR